jgi:hypothetical protein
MKCLRNLGLVATGLIASAAATASASAQVAIYNNYYEEAKSTICGTPNGATCNLYFTPLPQNVLISRVSCETSLNGTGGNAMIVDFQLAVANSATDNNFRRIETLPIPVIGNTSNGYTIYTTATPTDFLFGSGKYPVIHEYITGIVSIYLNCKITGRLQSANQP